MGFTEEKLRNIKAELDRQDRLMMILKRANGQYTEDNDLDAVIKAYEEVFIKEDPPLASSQNFNLVNYYLKAGRYDDAWKYLNILYKRKGTHKDRIRLTQAKIQKKEGKYKDAIGLYMRGYLLRPGDFKRDSFIRDIKGPAKKLGLNPEELADIVDREHRAGQKKERAVREKYAELLERSGL